MPQSKLSRNVRVKRFGKIGQQPNANANTDSHPEHQSASLLTLWEAILCYAACIWIKSSFEKRYGNFVGGKVQADKTL